MKPDDVPTREEVAQLAKEYGEAMALPTDKQWEAGVHRVAPKLLAVIDRLYAALSDEKLKRQQAEHERECILEDLAACRAELEASRKNEAQLRFLCSRMFAVELSPDGQHKWIFRNMPLYGPNVQAAINAAIDQARKDKT